MFSLRNRLQSQNTMKNVERTPTPVSTNVRYTVPPFRQCSSLLFHTPKTGHKILSNFPFKKRRTNRKHKGMRWNLWWTTGESILLRGQSAVVALFAMCNKSHKWGLPASTNKAASVTARIGSDKSAAKQLSNRKCFLRKICLRSVVTQCVRSERWCAWIWIDLESRWCVKRSCAGKRSNRLAKA